MLRTYIFLSIKKINYFHWINQPVLFDFATDLAIGSVDLIDDVGQEDLLLHHTVELLVLGVLVDLQVVTFEWLAHTGGREKVKYYCKQIVQNTII